MLIEWVACAAVWLILVYVVYIDFEDRFGGRLKPMLDSN
jgi:hypothetical protein